MGALFHLASKYGDHNEHCGSFEMQDFFSVFYVFCVYKNKLILVIFQIPTFEIGPVYIFLESKLTVARRKNEDLTRQYNLNDSFMGIK